MTAAEGIPEGFCSDESGGVAPRGKEAASPGTTVVWIKEKQLTDRSVSVTRRLSLLIDSPGDTYLPLPPSFALRQWPRR